MDKDTKSELIFVALGLFVAFVGTVLFILITGY